MIKTALVEESAGMPTQAFLVAEPCPKNQHPPTFIPRTEFSEAFQELIDTYGTPGYQEANPALLSAVTFPFIFGIMYGDVFHGGCLFLLGIYAILNADDLKYAGDGGKALYFARYMVFLMGLFAVYCGFIYNDFLSLGVNLFDSRWKVVGQADKEIYLDADYDTTNSGGVGPYPFGIDP